MAVFDRSPTHFVILFGNKSFTVNDNDKEEQIAHISLLKCHKSQ